jgi:hypothetical protein
LWVLSSLSAPFLKLILIVIIYHNRQFLQFQTQPYLHHTELSIILYHCVNGIRIVLPAFFTFQHKYKHLVTTWALKIIDKQ